MTDRDLSKLSDGEALWDFEETRCECGAEFDPMSPDWRRAGDHWQHYHGYPQGHSGRQVGYLAANEAKESTE